MWRGGTNGVGRIPRSAAELGAPDLMPRIRMCALLKGLPGVDARLYQVVNAEDPEPAIECLSRAGLMGDRVAEMSWLDRKLAIDIVGFSIAWQNLFVRLLFGCCVLKVASPAGFRQWYYDRLLPYEHCVPVKADVSDFTGRIAWCRDNPERCRAIGEAGQRLALSMNFEAEMSRSIAALGEWFHREEPAGSQG